MESFLAGWTKLTRLRFPAIQVIDPQNTSLEYQLVELVEFKFTFWQWLDRLTNLTAHRNLISKADFLKALNALTPLARQSLLVSDLPDGLQMGFDGERWKMFDFGPENFSFIETPFGQNLAEKTVWDENLTGDEKLKEKLRQVVLHERAKLCERILAARANKE
jgi:hypothetical protein